VEQVGELPVDVLDISEITFLSSERGYSNDSAPKLHNPQNAFAPPLAPSGKGGTWKKRADMPTARMMFSTSMVDGIIYAIGGVTVAPAWHAPGLWTVEAYDPATDTWTKKSNMPTARKGLSTSVVDGIIYAIGGHGGANDAACLSTVEAYNPATDAWTKKSDMPTARGWLSTSVLDGIIYAIGGEISADVSLSTVEAYDPVTDTWVQKSDMPTARTRLSTGVVDGVIYAIGGFSDVYFQTVEAYDSTTDTWAMKADMPTARSVFCTSVVDGIIYAIGGWGGEPDADGTFLSTVEAYDPAMDTWAKKADMPTGRAALSTSAVNGYIYAIGGWDVAANDVVEEYKPAQSGFSVTPAGKRATTWGRMKTGK
jgi:N-acetylneuraminic acid mutarotase